jgi:glycosyltransferase involved in cell wall biosynthesis
MKVSIVIPTIKTEEEIAPLILEIKNTVVHKLDLIIVSGKRSAAVNRNIGLEKAKGKFVVMCDDDIEQLPYGWDSNLIDALEHTGGSMVGPRLLNPNGSLQKTNYRNYDLSKDFVEVRRMIGALNIMRKSKLRYDENYLWWGREDTDFCKQLGGKFFVVNTVKVVHRNEHKNPYGSKEQETANFAYFIKKWGVKK